MPYSKFSLQKVQQEFGLIIHEAIHFLPTLPAVSPDTLLTATLADSLPLALAQGNEKARSEWIINPILTAVRRLANTKVSVFSGKEFNVDPSQELVGYVDFLIARSPRLLVLESPVVMMVEAKPENLNAGLGQCAAEMVAAQIFNQQPEKMIYGCVTNGELWKFLKLEGTDLTIDLEAYSLEPLERLLGILIYLACEG
ncbi:hypothetical protein IQ260_30295 [Leptolyngbya cf. ectocarpi LEGE 11479]|uniref:Restriction endonuclease subunit R n=1 Tax=Leptolyngbya cf. ectocarpi LEGE 11479 TaxID=1828722 RepID=A0A929A0U5_LEPEC|nr:hypothetical protein [Leptolyngbya ectocarpi]MBE9070931.1 hypothetical protein [Leptolyngbya cf. ectocarpi LEGE 11479]